MRGRAAAREQERSRLADALLSIPSERLIALGRLALAAFALVAITLDPPGDAREATASYVLILAFLLYSGALLAVEFLRGTGESSRMVMHVVDVIAAGLIMHFTHGPTGPFFLLFTFVLLAGTLRWNWRGAIGSAVVLLGAFLLLEILDSTQASANDRETIRLIMRGGYLLVAGVMFAYVGAHRERSLARLSALAAWPPEQDSEGEYPGPCASLAHTAEVLRATQVLLIWEEPDEPFVYVSVWSNGRMQSMREPPGTYGSIVAPELSEAVFVTPPSGDPRPRTPDKAGIVVAEAAVNPRLVEAFQIYNAVSAPVRTPSFEGRLFVIGPESLSDDATLLTEIAASRIGIELEYHRLHQQLQETAAIRERMRVARDIHDGVLQTLTAAGLQLKRLAQERPDATGPLDHIRAALAEQQRMLRRFVDDVLKRPADASENVSLDAAIRASLRSAAQQWELAGEVRVFPRNATASRRLTQQIAQLLHEAAANAARHGKASKISVIARQSPGAISLRVRDDGRGLSVKASEKELEPRSIQDRVTALGGQMQVHSSTRGFELRIEVPLPS